MKRGVTSTKRRPRRFCPVKGNHAPRELSPSSPAWRATIKVRQRDNQDENAPGLDGRSEGVARAKGVQPPRRTFPQWGQCGLAVVSDRVKCLIRLEIEGSAIARPSHHRP